MNKENSAQKPLLASETTIQERQIAIKVLTIGTKQVTQTLYRQLVEEPVINRVTGCLKGEIWGWVNLHATDCADLPTHLHTIWEDKGQLKRACSFRSPTGSYYETLSRELRQLVNAYINLVALDDRRFAGQTNSVTLTVKGRKISKNVSHAIITLWDIPQELEKYEKELAEVQAKDESEFPDYSPHVRKQGRIKELQERIARNRTSWVNDSKRQIKNELEIALTQIGRDVNQYTSHQDTYEEMEQIATELNLLEENWQKSYQTIKDATQLFIAVSGVWK